MAFVVAVQAEVVETIGGQPLLRVQNTETVQVPGPALQPMHGDLFAEVVERLGEDVKTRAMEQAREMLRQP